ncbi:hypothetical protein NL676_033459 [Syzygium grande]|nr:hypothetical protein NL676_033459 [Syzygium grande]
MHACRFPPARLSISARVRFSVHLFVFLLLLPRLSSFPPAPPAFQRPSVPRRRVNRINLIKTDPNLRLRSVSLMPRGIRRPKIQSNPLRATSCEDRPVSPSPSHPPQKFKKIGSTAIVAQMTHQSSVANSDTL